MSAATKHANVHVIRHPLAQAILTDLRNKETGQIAFRKGLVKVGRLTAYEIIKSFPVKEVYVETPLKVKAKGVRVPDLDHIVIINVLRAAMSLVEGLLKSFPLARQGVLAVQRIEEKEGIENIKAIKYFVKIPKFNSEDIIIIADPMLATGSTILEAIDEVYKVGKPKRLIVSSVISCEYGVNKLMEKHPEVELYTLAVDPDLNPHAYIVPGLGDAGDRSFG
jgi:uracil phosphoribosyltransferase